MVYVLGGGGSSTLVLQKKNLQNNLTMDHIKKQTISVATHTLVYRVKVLLFTLTQKIWTTQEEMILVSLSPWLFHYFPIIPPLYMEEIGLSVTWQLWKWHQCIDNLYGGVTMGMEASVEVHVNGYSFMVWHGKYSWIW